MDKSLEQACDCKVDSLAVKLLSPSVVFRQKFNCMLVKQFALLLNLHIDCVANKSQELRQVLTSPVVCHPCLFFGGAPFRREASDLKLKLSKDNGTLMGPDLNSWPEFKEKLR